MIALYQTAITGATATAPLFYAASSTKRLSAPASGPAGMVQQNANTRQDEAAAEGEDAGLLAIVRRLELRSGEIHHQAKCQGRCRSRGRECLVEPALSRPEWLSFNAAESTAMVTRLPEAGEVPFPIEMQHVVEYYAVRL